MWINLRTFIFLLTLGTLVGCGQKDNIIASVGDKDVTQKEFDAYLEFKRINKDDKKSVSAALEQYLEREALVQAVSQSDVLNKDLIEAELNSIKQEMMISRYFETYLKQNVTDQKIRNYYASNPDHFQSKKVKVAHILLRTHDKMSEQERRAKYNRAHEAYSKLNAGAKFAEIVTEYSEDLISAKKEGVIGWLGENAIDPIFANKVFNELQPGEISEPFHSKFGYHVAQVIEGPSIITKPFEKAQGDIRYQLRQAQKDSQLQQLLKRVTIKLH